MDFTRTIVTWLMVMMFQSVNIPHHTTNENEIEQEQELEQKQEREPNKYNNNLFLVLITKFACFFIYIFINLYYRSDKQLNNYEWTCFTLFVAGWLINLVSFLSLGEFFMFKIGIKKKHKLIETGIYKYIVHPTYAGTIMMTGTVLFYTPNIGTMSITSVMINIMSLILLTICMTVRKKRLDIEEKMMRSKFLEKYDEYIKQRWRIIPFPQKCYRIFR